MQKAKNIIGIVLCIIFAIILVINTSIVVKGMINPEKPPSVFGISPMVVLSGSMSGPTKYQLVIEEEPNSRYNMINSKGEVAAQVTTDSDGKATYYNLLSGEYSLVKIVKDGETEKSVPVRNVKIEDKWKAADIRRGDLIFIKDSSFEDAEIGDIIAYMENGSVVTHRVIQKTKTIFGTPALRTKGDANPIFDDELLIEENFIGTYQWRIGGIGNVIMFIQSTAGTILTFGLIIVIIGAVVVDSVRNKKNSESSEMQKKLEELEKKLAEKEKSDVADNIVDNNKDDTCSEGDKPSADVES